MSYAQTIITVEQQLIESHRALDTCFALPKDVRSYRVSSDSWTIDEILEHVTLTSHFLMLIIRAGVLKARKRAHIQVIPQAESDLTALTRIADPDAFAWIRPVHMEPTGQASPHDVQLLLRAQLEECLSLLTQIADGAGALHTVRMSVQDLGRLDMYQWLFFLAQHAQRHAIEIERIVAHLDCAPTTGLISPSPESEC